MSLRSIILGFVVACSFVSLRVQADSTCPDRAFVTIAAQSSADRYNKAINELMSDLKRISQDSTRLTEVVGTDPKFKYLLPKDLTMDESMPQQMLESYIHDKLRSVAQIELQQRYCPEGYTWKRGDKEKFGWREGFNDETFQDDISKYWEGAPLMKDVVEMGHCSKPAGWFSTKMKPVVFFTVTSDGGHGDENDIFWRQKLLPTLNTRRLTDDLVALAKLGFLYDPSRNRLVYPENLANEYLSAEH